MDVTIKHRLDSIAQERGVHILYACESGSRAWGFPSPDSDYDVRFIYVQSIDWHLSLFPKNDTIDIPINHELDLGGWEISKALKLLWKSNAALMEWVQSPIIYSVDSDFLMELRSVAEQCFSPIAVMYHYLSMSRNYLEICSGPQVKLKSYFYALRATLAANWIRLKQKPPHIEITRMLDIMEPVLQKRVLELIELKGNKPESYLHNSESLLSEYLMESNRLNEAVVSGLPAAKAEKKVLERFYQKVVKS